MILARYNLAAPSSEPLKLPALGVLMLSALGVAALCAAAVFLFLLTGEQHAPDPGANSSAASIAPLAATKRSTAAKPVARNPATLAQDSGAPPVEFERTDFSLFKSRSYRTAGPIRIRLLRTKRNESCDIAVLVNNRRTKRLGATVGTAIDIVLPGSLPHAKVVVTGIGSNRISGYLMAPKSKAKS